MYTYNNDRVIATPHYYRDIQGWFDFEEFYSWILQYIPNNAIIVELGSWKGKSTAYLATEAYHLDKGLSIYAVDTFAGTQDEPIHEEMIKDLGEPLIAEYWRNLNVYQEVKNNVATIVGTTSQAAKLFADESVDFVFLDAGHSYEDAKADIMNWATKVKYGGVLAGHDYGWEGVRQAVTEMLPGHRVFGNPNNSVWWIVR